MIPILINNIFPALDRKREMSISDVDKSEGSHLLDNGTANYTKLKQSEYREPLLDDTSQQDVYTLPLEEDASTDNLKSVTLSWRDLSASRRA